MKVTVCFGSTRVIVPCGRGEILVKDLIQQAITRYKKATGKGSISWVTVHSLQSQSDGGILDPDDRLRDVADDREQIIAFYDDGDNISPHQHVGGDGASITSSPDMFHSQDDGLQTDIQVTHEQISNAFPSLHVRRGSEPALNQLPLFDYSNNLDKKINNIRPIVSGQSKRWSAAPMIYDPKEKLKTNEYIKTNSSSDKWRYSEENLDEIHDDDLHITNHFLAPSFNRDSLNRLSIQFSGESSGGFRWGESSDITNQRTLSLSLPRNHRRKEPLGQANTNPINSLPESQNIQFITLNTEGGSLGIHVVPDYNTLGKECGLLVQGIEPNGRVHCDGRLKMYDRIIEINGRSLLNQPFNVIQEIFRDSLHSSELKLKVIKHNKNMDIGTVHNIDSNKTDLSVPASPITTKNVNLPFSNKENITLRSSNKKISSNAKVATISPTKKISATTPAASNILMVANTRKLGRKMELELIKGPHGLGFSITTRDNPAGGNCPIYIKNVLPKGAAVEDGRLRPGDRLLAVNDIEFTGMNQSEAVTILRKVPPGAKVKIIVSRQEDVINQVEQKCCDEIDEVVKKESSEFELVETNEKAIDTVQGYEKCSENNQTFPWRHKEILTFEIPVHDTEKAGLGISVKGKTSTNTINNKDISQDLGIFIKNVIHGGAASRDGRLRTNDQLLYVNGISLIGQSNAFAMELLRKTMMNIDPTLPMPGAISLTIARRHSSPTLYRRFSRDSSTSLTDSSVNTEIFGCPNNSYTQNKADNSQSSEKSDNTVIFMQHRQDLDTSNQNKLPEMISPNGIAFRNPVLERLTGNYNGLRNESYYKANNKTIISKEDKSILNSPIINESSEEMLIIQDIPKYNTDISQNKTENKSSQELRTTSTSTDVTYASQLSLDNANSEFSRDAFGRQSMSEKRHATLDARNTNTYQKNKKLRERRSDGNQSNDFSLKQQLGPSLGMKKSSSLESLQTLVQEVEMLDNRKQCDDQKNYQQSCNRKSIHSQIDYKVPNIPTIENKKKAGLFKGIGSIGSIFRFGKPRRGLDLNSEDNLVDNEQELARKNARNEQLRIKEQYQILTQRQKEQQNYDVSLDEIKTNYATSSRTLSNQEQLRMDRIQQLKAEHQKRHIERNANIPQDNYDTNLNQPNINQQNAINFPGSRVGIIDSARFNHYVNFQEIQQNLNLMHEIPHVKLRHHEKTKKVKSYYDTSNESRNQLHYHSQRREPKESITRPSSNYYEYESVMNSLPYITVPERSGVIGGISRLVDNNSNSLTRQVDNGSINQISNNITTVRSPKLSKQPSSSEIKSFNYDTYNNIGNNIPGQNSVRQKSHRLSTTNNINYNNRLYQHNNNHNYQKIKVQEPPSYVTHVTIRENKNTIKSPNI